MTSPQRLFWLCLVSITVQKEGNTLIYVKKHKLFPLISLNSSFCSASTVLFQYSVAMNEFKWFFLKCSFFSLIFKSSLPKSRLHANILQAVRDLTWSDSHSRMQVLIASTHRLGFRSFGQRPAWEYTTFATDMGIALTRQLSM